MLSLDHLPEFDHVKHSRGHLSEHAPDFLIDGYSYAMQGPNPPEMALLGPRKYSSAIRPAEPRGAPPSSRAPLQLAQEQRAAGSWGEICSNPGGF